jgi:outer membrane protein OmpA-like peptidoglycan-associated protein
VEWLVGGYRRLGDVLIRAGGGSGLTAGIMSPELRLVLGAVYAPARPAAPSVEVEPAEPAPSRPAPEPVAAPEPEPEPEDIQPSEPEAPRLATLDGDRIDIRDTVFFDSNRSVIQGRSHPLLDDVAAVLRAHPEITLLRVEGHTDTLGDAAYNKDLSQQRAQEVVTYLVAAGIAADRLVAVGFGEERPIDPANTREAHARNRRVAFFVAGRAD